MASRSHLTAARFWYSIINAYNIIIFFVTTPYTPLI